ncbi:MAG: carbohydrate ABC transporter permease [Micromonosporaceae bacterium]
MTHVEAQPERAGENPNRVGVSSHAAAKLRAVGSAAGRARVTKARRPGGARPGRFGLYAGLLVMLLFTLFPVYWLAATAVTPDSDAFAAEPRLIPSRLTLDHFANFFANPDLLRYLMNSLVISLVSSIGGLLVSVYAAYSLSKFRFRGRGSVLYLILSSQMFPQALLLITLYLVFNKLNLLNTYLGLVVSFMAFTLPLSIWLLKGFFDNIPDELLEAAELDGASRLVTLHRIVLPLVTPALASAGLFTFVKAWDDFIFALTLSGEETRTLPPGLLLTYLGEAQAAWPDLMAASLIVSFPVVIAFVAIQRYFIAGLTAGAVKS